MRAGAPQYLKGGWNAKINEKRKGASLKGQIN